MYDYPHMLVRNAWSPDHCVYMHNTLPLNLYRVTFLGKEERNTERNSRLNSLAQKNSDMSTD